MLRLHSPTLSPARRLLSGLLGACFLCLGVGDAAADELRWTFPVSGDSEFEIALDVGDVTVLAHDADEIRIETVTRGLGASSVRFRAEPRAHGAVLTGTHEPWIGWMNVGPNVSVRAWVPRHCTVAIHTAARATDVRTVDGGVVASFSPLLRPRPGRDVRIAQASRSTLRLRETGGAIRLLEP